MLIIRFQLDETERYKVSRVFADAAAYVKTKKEQGQETENIFLFGLNSKHLLAVICK